jgi:hypothetical protein
VDTGARASKFVSRSWFLLFLCTPLAPCVTEFPWNASLLRELQRPSDYHILASDPRALSLSARGQMGQKCGGHDEIVKTILPVHGSLSNFDT